MRAPGAPRPAMAGALHRSVGGRAAFGDAEDDDDEGLLGVAKGEVAAVGGRGGAAAFARAVAKRDGSVEG